MYPIHRRLSPTKILGRLVLASAAAAAAAIATCSTAAASSDPATDQSRGTSGPTLSTDRGCYFVAQPVQLSGSGFVPDRGYRLSIDGTSLGSAAADSAGQFSMPVYPGGLPAGTPQRVAALQVTDGTNTTQTTVTITRPAGARIIETKLSRRRFTGRYQVWGFSTSGEALPVYAHYIDSSGTSRGDRLLGKTAGQCGYIFKSRQCVFPFNVRRSSSWRIQIDRRPSYERYPRGPVARIRITIR